MTTPAAMPHHVHHEHKEEEHHKEHDPEHKAAMREANEQAVPTNPLQVRVGGDGGEGEGGEGRGKAGRAEEDRDGGPGGQEAPLQLRGGKGQAGCIGAG